MATTATIEADNGTVEVGRQETCDRFVLVANDDMGGRALIALSQAQALELAWEIMRGAR
jgi:hypothetical protein